jgi:hypothetical protein
LISFGAYWNFPYDFDLQPTFFFVKKAKRFVDFTNVLSILQMIL